MQPELTLTWGRSADRDRPLARRWLWATVALTAGAFIIAAAFAPSGSAAPDRGLAWVLFAGSSAHVASTGWLYTLRDVRSYAVSHPWRFIRVPVLLMIAGAAAAVTLTPAAMAGAVAAGVIVLARRAPAQRPRGFCVMYLMGLFFSVPVFVFASPYAAVGGMTIAHGMQYLLLVSLVAAGGPGEAGRALRLAVLCNVALIGGAVLAVTSHLHSGGPAVRLVFGAYLGAVMAHFVVDAGLWRLRDPFPRVFLARRVPYLMRAAPAVRSGADIR